jgi:hypothetical protein
MSFSSLAVDLNEDLSLRSDRLAPCLDPLLPTDQNSDWATELV